jgi:trehalose 6-phosphate phosphatase
LIGSHGAESGSSEAASGARGADRFLDVLEPVCRRFPGSELETKPHSVAFHYRRVAEGRQDAARQDAVEAAGELAVDVRSGKKVVEFMAVRTDKGSALERYRSETGADAVVFIGDDVTDEEAFRTLAANDVSVKVGPEPTAAGFRVADPVEVAALLERLLRYRTRTIGVSS